jgi:hypothetical protein
MTGMLETRCSGKSRLTILKLCQAIGGLWATSGPRTLVTMQATSFVHYDDGDVDGVRLCV